MFRVLCVLMCFAHFNTAKALDEAFDEAPDEAPDEALTLAACENESSSDVHLDLSKMGLRTIGKPFASGPVTCINLAENRIVNLQGAFDYLPDLRQLNLTGNPISLAGLAGINFPTLRTLVFDGPAYDSYSSQGSPTGPKALLPRLTKLSLRNYGDASILTRLDHFDLPALRHLHIGGNRLNDGNRLTNFTRNLTHLNIDYNGMNSFALNLPNIRYLSMAGNRIDNICSDNCNEYSLSIRNTSKLVYLSLESNRISSIEPGAFIDSHRLRILNLARNKIVCLPRHMLDDMANLKNLSLNNNDLSEIPDVCRLKRLEALGLSGNKIRKIDAASFCQLPNLRSIDISRNNLTVVTSATFGHLPGLKDLDLSWNNIASLPADWLQPGSRSLQSLNLDGNQFQDIAGMSVRNVRQLREISIGHNPLRTVTIGALLSLPPETRINVSRDCLEN